MDTPPPTPPGFVDSDWYWRHKDAFDYLHWKEKDIELPKTAVAESVEQAEKDVEKARRVVKNAQERMDNLQSKNPIDIAETKADLARAIWGLSLMQLRLANTHVAKHDKNPERSTNLAEKKEGPSAFFPSVTVKSGGRLKTRRTKKRNGSTRIRKHKIRRMSQRQKS